MRIHGLYKGLEFVYDSLHLDDLSKRIVVFVEEYNKNKKPQIKPLEDLLLEAIVGVGRLESSPKASLVYQHFGIDKSLNIEVFSGMIRRLAGYNWRTSKKIIAELKALDYSIQNVFFLRNGFDFFRTDSGPSSENNKQASFTIRLVDYDDDGVQVERMSKIFKSLNLVHEACTRVVENFTADLRISFIESGSDILVDLKSTVDVIKQLEATFHKFWDKTKFWKFEDFNKKMESIGRGLDVITLIDKKIKDSTLDEDTAQNLKRTILNELYNLVELGSLPESILEKGDQNYQRELLKARKETKQLEAPEK